MEEEMKSNTGLSKTNMSMMERETMFKVSKRQSIVEGNSNLLEKTDGMSPLPDEGTGPQNYAPISSQLLINDSS